MSGNLLLLIIFYSLGAFVLVSSLMAVSRRNPVHAVIFLILSFLGTAALFFLLGAPFIAALEVIIYAGALMVLFLFIIMTIKPDSHTLEGKIRPRQWAPAALLGMAVLVLVMIPIFMSPVSRTMLPTAMASPRAFGQAFFERYWFPIEIASFLLFVGLAGALYLGRDGSVSANKNIGGQS